MEDCFEKMEEEIKEAQLFFVCVCVCLEERKIHFFHSFLRERRRVRFESSSYGFLVGRAGFFPLSLSFLDETRSKKKGDKNSFFFFLSLLSFHYVYLFFTKFGFIFLFLSSEVFLHLFGKMFRFFILWNVT